MGRIRKHPSDGQPGAVEDLSREVLRAQFETNVFGTLDLTNRLIPWMRRSGHGRIIQNSSVLGFVALRYRGEAYRLDVYVVALFLSPRDVAFYSIATSIAELSWYIPNSVGIVLFPKLSNEPEEKIHSLTAEVCRHTLFITLLATGGVVLAGVLAMVLALVARDLVFWLVLFAWAGLGASLGPAVIFALYWKRTTMVWRR